jgi:hypothetical protein
VTPIALKVSGCIVAALALAPLTMAGLGGCNGDPDGEPACAPELSSLRATVFVSCLGAACHGAGEPVGALDLESDGIESRLVGRVAATCERILVVPGDPGSSFLYDKIASSSPGCGLPMPLDAPLDPELIACVGDWISGLEAACETCGGEICIDRDSDPLHCGACDNACPDHTTCTGGSCVCAGGLSFCGGACVETSSDVSHCGGCDMACMGGLVCSLGACKDSCDAELVACSGSCVDTAASPLHCGGCDAPCGATEVCSNGTCQCPGGADTKTDPNNCGACGHACSPGEDCVDGSCTCGSSSVSFSADVQPIFTSSCTGNACHGGTMPSASLDLTSGKSYGELVGVATEQCNGSRILVIPGDPANSYLLDKILGVDMCFGSKMPKMDSLPASEIAAISSWICAGAPNN